MFLKRLDTRAPRLLLAAAIIVAVASVVMERAVYSTSIEAVVNAPRIEMVAPIEGMVDSVGAELGQQVARGTMLVRLRRDGFSADGAQTLNTRSALLNGKADIIARELTTLIELQESLETRESRFRQTLIERLEADLAAAESRLTERRLVDEQTNALVGVNGSSKLDVTRARTALVEAQSDVTRLRTTLRAAKANIMSDQSGQDVPYSRQRIDQLTVDIARLRAERDALKNEALTIAAGAVETQTDSTGAVQLSAPTSGAIWQITAVPGERVLRGAPLATVVDCSRVYLEATVTPRDADKIDLTKEVIVRLAGTTDEARGRVRAVRGGGLRIESASAAELRQQDRRGDSRVLIDVDVSTIHQSSANFCQVGRHAKVFFDDRAPLRPLQFASRQVSRIFQ
ncbi:MAG: efflux RND transporter periplasmic adaptor subunit [Gemmatimonadaceae bacterium]|nr:efflux RND transporter periplasmic adaptor subunit [Gemmatimonadaceae bacterium]